MKTRIQILALAVMFLSGSLIPALAGDAPKGAKADAQKEASGNIQLKEKEIQGTLKDIVGTLNLNQTEILGDEMVIPNMSYTRPWSNPDPFPDESEDLSRVLIEQAYAPVDRDSLMVQMDIVSGPANGDYESTPSSEFASGQSDLSAFISYASDN